MNSIFGIALDLSPIEIIVVAFAAFSFLILFGLSSVKGDYKGLISTTLANDADRRNKKK